MGESRMERSFPSFNLTHFLGLRSRSRHENNTVGHECRAEIGVWGGGVGVGSSPVLFTSGVSGVAVQWD